MVWVCKVGLQRTQGSNHCAAFADYQRTQFGAWPWPSDAPTHLRDKPRFAKYPDGREEVPTAGGGSTVTGGSSSSSSGAAEAT